MDRTAHRSDNPTSADSTQEGSHGPPEPADELVDLIPAGAHYLEHPSSGSEGYDEEEMDEEDEGDDEDFFGEGDDFDWQDDDDEEDWSEEGEDTELEDPSDSELGTTDQPGDLSQWEDHCRHTRGEPAHLDAMHATSTHFQAADALAACSGRDRDLIVTSHDRDVTLWELPHRPAEGQPACIQLAHIRLSLVTSYSLAISPDGRQIAIGGESGLLAILAVEQTLVEGVLQTRLRPVTAVCMGDVSNMGVDMHNMINSIRFGLLAGKMRILVAGQDGFVTVLETLPTSDAAPGGLACSSLRPAADVQQAAQVQEPKRQVLCVPLVDSGNSRFTADFEESQVITTTAIGKFLTPLNCAVASPCGRYVAVTCDAPEVHLLGADSGYSFAHGAVLGFDDLHMEVSRRARRIDPGAQYCAFNCDSSLLAVTSDAFRVVLVFDVASRERLLCLDHHLRACLPISFLPHDPALFVYAEERNRCYIADVRFGSHGIQRIDVEQTVQSAVKITGLAVTASSHILLATHHKVLRWDVVKAWTTTEHQHFPPGFKDAVRLLLLAANRQPSASVASHPDGSRCGFPSLPRDVLLSICGLAALPLAAWRQPANGAAPAAATPPTAQS